MVCVSMCVSMLCYGCVCECAQSGSDVYGHVGSDVYGHVGSDVCGDGSVLVVVQVSLAQEHRPAPHEGASGDPQGCEVRRGALHSTLQS